MRILVICDDYWHPAAVPREGLAPLANDDMHFDFIEDAADWSAARMSTYPVVLFTKSNDVSSQDRAEWVDGAVERAFVDFVRQGGGLLAVHSGTTGYSETPALRALLGGIFTNHPKQCPVEVQLQDGHPLCQDSTPFTQVDEHYFMELDDQQADVL